MKNIKRISTALIALIMLMAMASCGSKENADTDKGSADKKATSDISVTLSIDFPDDSGLADVKDLNMEVTNKSSVLAVLNIYAKGNDGEVLLDKSSKTAYVTSINGVAATDTAGWIYEINDEAVMDSVDKASVKDGDKISWSFDEFSE